MNKQFSLKKALTGLFLCKKISCEIYKFCSVESPKKKISSRLDDVVKGQYKTTVMRIQSWLLAVILYGFKCFLWNIIPKLSNKPEQREVGLWLLLWEEVSSQKIYFILIKYNKCKP